jgi:nucleotide-binding universal stress UspA family protein
MFSKILVAIDRLSLNKEVFEKALTLAKMTKANLMIVHVLSPYEEGYPEMPFLSNLDCYPGRNDASVKLYLEQWEAFKEEGLKLLRDRAAIAASVGVNVEYLQIPGTPGYTICDVARTWGADLIILGRRGRSGISEFIMGSVSNYVTHHATCSVLTVHNQVNSNHKVSQTDQIASAPWS